MLCNWPHNRGSQRSYLSSVSLNGFVEHMAFVFGGEVHLSVEQQGLDSCHFKEQRASFQDYIVSLQENKTQALAYVANRCLASGRNQQSGTKIFLKLKPKAIKRFHINSIWIDRPRKWYFQAQLQALTCIKLTGQITFTDLWKIQCWQMNLYEDILFLSLLLSIIRALDYVITKSYYQTYRLQLWFTSPLRWGSCSRPSSRFPARLWSFYAYVFARGRSAARMNLC